MSLNGVPSNWHEHIFWTLLPSLLIEQLHEEELGCRKQVSLNSVGIGLIVGVTAHNTLSKSASGAPNATAAPSDTSLPLLEHRSASVTRKFNRWVAASTNLCFSTTLLISADCEDLGAVLGSKLSVTELCEGNTFSLLPLSAAPCLETKGASPFSDDEDPFESTISLRVCGGCSPVTEASIPVNVLTFASSTTVSKGTDLTGLVNGSLAASHRTFNGSASALPDASSLPLPVDPLQAKVGSFFASSWRQLVESACIVELIETGVSVSFPSLPEAGFWGSTPGLRSLFPGNFSTFAGPLSTGTHFWIGTVESARSLSPPNFSGSLFSCSESTPRRFPLHLWEVSSW